MRWTGERARSRRLQTADSFNVVSTDAASSIKILDEVATELAKEEEEMARNAKQPMLCLSEVLPERWNEQR